MEMITPTLAIALSFVASNLNQYLLAQREKKMIVGAFERFVPRDVVYEHHLRWQDGNGHSHVRASIIGPSLTIPIIKGRMPLGTWQQIVFLELDVRSRTRRIVIQALGE